MTAWDRRIERARQLEIEYPAAAELLSFYREIFISVTGYITPNWVIGGYVACHRNRVLELFQRAGPPDLAEAAGYLAATDDWDPGDPVVQFVDRILAQANAHPIAAPGGTGAVCPACGELPVVAVLRPEGEGGRRSLVCSLCFTEWTFRRLVCPKCGEEDQHKLPVFTAEQFPHVRIEACDTCRTYVKSVDMTRNGLAVPEVDELASLPLDLWAAEQHYIKLQPNLFGL